MAVKVEISEPTSQLVSSELCIQKYGGVLSGFDTMDEINYMIGQISQFLCSHPLHRIHGMDTGLMDFEKKRVASRIKLTQIAPESK
ncbi:hypothetical protein GCK72_001761 [Caenorhabditis remanei]|uniref:Uncharacterized protein n=1 Tax=Caenorhabditis remanei TaxID=31234 RepID=A0A6A5HTI6_CAERE|nr:hypothetical protein GCK72_001761 [Caenorhabditis remanei]KAF1769944.1 hypothetical protein GCK72_001761 [Caenorhabditis remanei]